jgi:SLOG cluster3 family
MKRAIFLSASVPFREPFVSECDPVAIREAVLALVAVSVRERPLVFGGHPAISPLVEHAARSLGALKNVHIYQSRFFEDKIPEVARKFENLHWTARASDQAESLSIMRKEMLSSLDFSSAVFVGGMEGIFEESKWFSELQGDKPQLAIGSTGGAAGKLLQDMRGAFDDKTYKLLQEERRYRRVFRQLLPKE